MEKLLGEHWLKHYLAELTEREKAEIKSALLKNLQNGSHPLQDLQSYLQAMKLLAAYPIHC